MLDVVKDTVVDGLKLIPFLFISFLIIEYIEHKLTTKNKKAISKSGKYGPIIGGLLGIVPQCGFSVTATNLYVTRIITLGTLISIYLSTSDEMLPILISEKTDVLTILKILGIKLIIGIICGFFIDLVMQKGKKKKDVTYDICNDDDCHCKDKNNIFVSAFIHTLKTLSFIVLISFVLNIIIYYVGEDYLSKMFLRNSLFSPFLMSLIGLIPNCGASIIITELYLNHAISLGSTIAGLLTGSGVALLVLFKTNKNIKENLMIMATIYIIGVVFGTMIELIELVI